MGGAIVLAVLLIIAIVTEIAYARVMWQMLYVALNDASHLSCGSVCFVVCAVAFELAAYASVLMAGLEILATVVALVDDVRAAEHVEIRVEPSRSSLYVHSGNPLRAERYDVQYPVAANRFRLQRAMFHTLGLALTRVRAATTALQVVVLHFFAFSAARTALRVLLRYVGEEYVSKRRRRRARRLVLWCMKRSYAAAAARAAARAAALKNDDDDDGTKCDKGKDGFTCSICFASGGGMRCRTVCGHTFHAACVKAWLEVSQGDCPLCRAPQRLKSLLYCACVAPGGPVLVKSH